MSGTGSPTEEPIDCHDLRVAVVAASWHQQVMDGLAAELDASDRIFATDLSARWRSGGFPPSCDSAWDRKKNGIAPWNSTKTAGSIGAPSKTTPTSAFTR